MSKWFGKIGFYQTEKTGAGVYNAAVTEREYYGDVYRSKRKYETGSSINNDINMSVEISILSDHFVNEHLPNIKYVEYMGTKWNVTDITPEYPRLTLSLGGIYDAGKVTADYEA